MITTYSHFTSMLCVSDHWLRVSITNSRQIEMVLLRPSEPTGDLGTVCTALRSTNQGHARYQCGSPRYSDTLLSWKTGLRDGADALRFTAASEISHTLTAL